uniref:Uncharacterized protein n=1 Tax=Cucumis melo TaxID=3656 RepID=A0A9I9EIV1_CUCME
MKKPEQLVFTRNQEVSGFSCISKCTGGVRISIWYGWKAYSIYYNVHEEIRQVKEVVCRDSGSGYVSRGEVVMIGLR